jgi:hypothetical protein
MVRSTLGAALPTARVVLRALVVLNWLGGAAILALLIATVVAESWTMHALGIAEGDDIRSLLTPLRAIAVLGVAAVPINDVVLRRLLAMIATVRDGDPFVATNARRLQSIAWALLALQLIGLAVAAIGKTASTPAHPLHVDAGFSISGWLAVLLTFILAHVFAAGARLRDDLAGTV